ncbi:hypothetical protein GCM10023194_78050 [Planotetraspora phitsanulokensis]|uniref:Uncharacterized protein n=1 Tax=Planotetraspora phitsanulokensis TaxID=575192 RepID=A0A8J3XIM7_9ACTN|nr:hypothetical protein [Planotetraspora phitsanulokensis]GII41091.1 hypothetical protein Pph01_60940 [Planotetraspora phitsanulokensis]
MRPHQETSVLREPYRIAGLWVRVILLVVLLWGGLLTVLSANPRERSAADFQAALRAKQVTYVLYEGDDNHVRGWRWSTGPLLWYRAQELTRPTPMRPDLTVELDTVDPRPVVRWVSGHDNTLGPFPNWPFQVPEPTANLLVKVAWIATFVIMIGTARPRLGNRWAWFWLFTIGEIGAIMFLFSEPRAVWRGLGPQGPDPGRMGGGRGFLMAICLNWLISIVAFVGIFGGVQTLLDVLVRP